MMFWSNLGNEEISASGTSYLNRTEAFQRREIVTRFFKLAFNSRHWSHYPVRRSTKLCGQLHAEHWYLQEGELQEIEVASVDAFQVVRRTSSYSLAFAPTIIKELVS